MVELSFGTALLAIGAGLSIGLAGAMSGIGQGRVAAVSVGAVAEDPSMFSRGIVFTALPETQAIYGFLIALLLIVFSGMMAGQAVSTNFGILAIGAGLAIGVAAAGSALGQSNAAVASVGAVVEEPTMFARGIVFSALPETQAIYGFLVALLLIVFSGVMGA
ncbi:MAG: V-type ATP synthase subunit K [Methanobacteriaceae archaeon]|nr:V-type ATP synthase subunit K [Methanobacteriaceae archaeon]